jgi:hypothetical protein
MTASKKEIHSSYADFSDDTEPQSVTEEIASNLNELLTTKQIPLLSSREQFRLADIVECIGVVEKHRRSIDDNAGRFLLFFRQHIQSKVQKGAISWREITWAFHSGSQDILADLVSRHFNGKMLWQHAKESGIFMWITDINALVCTLPPSLLHFLTFIARSFRSHSTERIHQDGGEEPRRLRPVLFSFTQEARSLRSVAHGYLVSRASCNVSTAG